MAFQATEVGAFVRVRDTGQHHTHYLAVDDYKSFDPAAPGAQARLAGLALYTVNQWGDLKKSPVKIDEMLADYLTLRGGAVRAEIPQSVRDAVAMLVAAVG